MTSVDARVVVSPRPDVVVGAVVVVVAGVVLVVGAVVVLVVLVVVLVVRRWIGSTVVGEREKVPATTVTSASPTRSAPANTANVATARATPRVASPVPAARSLMTTIMPPDGSIPVRIR